CPPFLNQSGEAGSPLRMRFLMSGIKSVTRTLDSGRKRGGPEEPPSLTFANLPQKPAYIDCDRAIGALLLSVGCDRQTYWWIAIVGFESRLPCIGRSHVAVLLKFRDLAALRYLKSLLGLAAFLAFAARMSALRRLFNADLRDRQFRSRIFFLV